MLIQITAVCISNDLLKTMLFFSEPWLIAEVGCPNPVRHSLTKKCVSFSAHVIAYANSCNKRAVSSINGIHSIAVNHCNRRKPCWRAYNNILRRHGRLHPF